MGWSVSGSWPSTLPKMCFCSAAEGGQARGPELRAVCQEALLACKTQSHPVRSAVQVLKPVQAKKLPYAPHRSLGMCLFLCEEVESIRQRQGAVCKATVVTQLSKTLMGQ